MFILADCNNFFVSCERLFNPKLEGRPVIVLSNNDGCVVARSQEAKQLGIAMCDPYFKIKELCERRGIVALSSNLALYQDLSRRVMEVLSGEAEEIEVYSVDEAFLFFSDPKNDLEAFCVAMREKVKRWTGIPISLGIAPTKTLAKVAGDRAKKERTGVFDLSARERQQAVLQQTPVSDVWGIGSRTAEKLHALQIWTAWQLQEMEIAHMRRQFGVVGERMLLELKGVSCFHLDRPSPKKSITHSRSFGQAVTSFKELEETLAAFVSEACVKLRRQTSFASELTVFVESTVPQVLFEAAEEKSSWSYSKEVKRGARSYGQRTATLERPTDDTSLFITAAKECLFALFVEGRRYKRCGVTLHKLTEASAIAPDLFLQGEPLKRRELMRALDTLNARFGEKALFFAAEGVHSLS